MKIARTLVAKAALLCLLFGCGSAVAQTTSQNATAETITVTGARPVADAMDVIERRYGVLIDYVDPLYEAPQDIEHVASKPGHIIPVPKIRTLSVQYMQLNEPPKNIPYLRCNAETLGCAPVEDWPRSGITALIQKVLNQFAADGGQVFGVRKLNMSYGPRWEVYPVKARNALGTFVRQTDFLGAPIRIPRQKRAPGDMIDLIARQLTRDWGRKFWVALAQFPVQPMSVRPQGNGEGSRVLTARRAILDLLGPNLVLRMYGGPDDGSFAINIVAMPYREPRRPPNPPPPKPPNLAPQPLPVDGWLWLAHTPKGTLDLQTALAKAGYLHTLPTTHWDKNAAQAIRRLQAAYHFPVTGKLDQLTVFRLEAYLPKYMLPPPPEYLTPNPLGRFLLNWLQSTRRGQMDIQRALAEEGFYSGPLTGAFDLKTRNALVAYQKANGLKPTGIFDDATSRKLAPLLLKMKN